MRGFSVAELTEKQKQSRETDEKSKTRKAKKIMNSQETFLNAVTLTKNSVLNYELL